MSPAVYPGNVPFVMYPEFKLLSLPGVKLRLIAQARAELLQRYTELYLCRFPRAQGGCPIVWGSVCGIGHSLRCASGSMRTRLEGRIAGITGMIKDHLWSCELIHRLQKWLFGCENELLSNRRKQVCGDVSLVLREFLLNHARWNQIVAHPAGVVC